MTNPSKIFWIIAGGLFLAASIAINYKVKFAMHHQTAGSVHEMGNIKVGQAAPDFTLRDLSSNSVALSSYQGREVVLLDFWATWCPPCRMSMPGLQELADKFKGKGLEILSVDQGEAADQVSNFIKRKKYTFHAVLDADQAAAARYGVRGIPTLVLVDKHGVVQWIRVGYSGNEDELGQVITNLIKE
jgi:peroxiredoxin